MFINVLHLKIAEDFINKHDFPQLDLTLCGIS